MTNKQTFGELRRRVTCGLRKVPSVSENFAGKRKSNGINKQAHTEAKRERGRDSGKEGETSKAKANMEMGMEMIIKMQMSPDVGTKICLIATLIINLAIVYIASNLSSLPPLPF